MHGKTSPVMHDNKTVFQGLPMPMTATRYHSLIVEEKDLPSELEVSAWTTEKDGTRTIMGLRHKQHPVEGVQFHPESVLTDAGKKLVANFLRKCDSSQHWGALPCAVSPRPCFWQYRQPAAMPAPYSSTPEIP